MEDFSDNTFTISDGTQIPQDKTDVPSANWALYR